MDEIMYMLDTVRDRAKASAVVTMIDVRNMLNATMWNKFTSLKAIRVSEYPMCMSVNYFEPVDLKIGRENMLMTQGVPQGSVLGFTL